MALQCVGLIWDLLSRPLNQVKWSLKTTTKPAPDAKFDPAAKPSTRLTAPAVLRHMRVRWRTCKHSSLKFGLIHSFIASIASNWEAALDGF